MGWGHYWDMDEVIDAKRDADRELFDRERGRDAYYTRASRRASDGYVYPTPQAHRPSETLLRERGE